MEYVIIYLKSNIQSGIMEFEKENIPSNLNDFISELLCSYNSFELYSSVTNIGLMGLFVKVENENIIYKNDNIYNELIGE